MKKVLTILATDLGYDGYTREIVALASSLVDLYDIHFVLKEKSNESIIMNSKIKVTVKNPNMLECRKFYKDMFKNSSLVLVTSHEFNKYVIRYAKCKTILWEHTKRSLSNLKYLVKYDIVVVPNMELKKYYLEYNKNTIIINDGILIPEDREIRNGLNIIFVGKLTKDKKLDVLLDIFKKIVNIIPTNLIIIGSGNARTSFEEKVKKEHIKNVYFKGLLTKEEIEKELLSSAVYVNMNEFATNNLSMLEAMSYGVPIISFDREESLFPFIVDDINGFLIKNQNEKVMYEKIKMLLENPYMLESFSLCAKEKSLEFDIYSLKIEWLKIL